MSDAAAILALYDHARAHALPAVLATVIGTEGSTYRKSGARMMLCGDGSRVGVVSGGCLEGDVARRAWFLKSPGAAERVRYDTGNGDDATYEFGLGCRGVVEVLLERLDTAGPEPLIVSCLRESIVARRSIDLLTTIRGDAIGIRRLLDHGGTGIPACDSNTFHERLDPPIQLLIFGSGIDVAPVVQIARSLGWRPLVIDDRRASPEVSIASPPGEWQSHVTLDARTAAVVMTHRMTDDAGYLRDLVVSPVAYIGCLGPRSRTEALFDELALTGVTLSSEQRSRVHAPVGLDLAAERPQEIALAIVAEVQAVLAGASGGKLSDRDGPIHPANERQQAISSSFARGG